MDCQYNAEGHFTSCKNQHPGERRAFEKALQQTNGRASNMRQEKAQVKNHITPNFRFYSNFSLNSPLPFCVLTPFPYDWLYPQPDLGTSASSLNGYNTG